MSLAFDLERPDVLTLTAADAYLLAGAAIRAAHLIAEHRSGLALQTLCDVLEDLPGAAAAVDIARLRAALAARADLAPCRHTETSER